jgi:hypothetical protein
MWSEMRNIFSRNSFGRLKYISLSTVIILQIMYDTMLAVRIMDFV